MKIYTSYFAKIKDLPENIIPVSISRYPPKNLKIREYSKFFPPWSIIKEYKITGNQDKYTKDYNNLVLCKLNRDICIQDLIEIGGRKDICLCCYEKSNDFCHRHIVAKWLNYDISEYLFSGK